MSKYITKISYHKEDKTNSTFKYNTGILNDSRVLCCMSLEPDSGVIGDSYIKNKFMSMESITGNPIDIKHYTNIVSGVYYYNDGYNGNNNCLILSKHSSFFQYIVSNENLQHQIDVLTLTHTISNNLIRHDLSLECLTNAIGLLEYDISYFKDTIIYINILEDHIDIHIPTIEFNKTWFEKNYVEYIY